jgi:hypothetical protein
MCRATLLRDASNASRRCYGFGANMSEIKFPDFPKKWGPFLAFTAGITVSAFAAAAMARTDTSVIVIGGIATTALVVGLVARVKGVL